MLVEQTGEQFPLALVVNGGVVKRLRYEAGFGQRVRRGKMQKRADPFIRVRLEFVPDFALLETAQERLANRCFIDGTHSPLNLRELLFHALALDIPIEPASEQDE